MIKTLKKDKSGKPQKINYIFSNPNSKLYKKLSKDNKYKEFIQFHAGNTSQGKEGQYWIVENNREVSSLSTYLQELYTGISRSEQGSIIIASSNYTGNLAKLTLKNTQNNVKIGEGFSEEIKQRQLEKLIKFYGDLTLEEHIVDILRDKPESLKNPFVEELRKVEADASLTEDPIYFTIVSEDPLIIKVGDDKIPISKEDLINKIKTENYRLQEKQKEDEVDISVDITNDEVNKDVTEKLNDDLSKKHLESLQRIPSQESQKTINYYQYLYSAFSMETSVEVDDNGKIVLTDSGELSTDPNDKRIDNIIGLYKYFNRTLDYHTLHTKLNALRLAFLTNSDKASLQQIVCDILSISEDQRKDLYMVFGYKKTNSTTKDDGNREQNDVYAKANKTNKETIEYSIQGGARSNEVGVNNLVVNIGFDKTGDFLEIPLMRFASPISIMYQTDSEGNYLFQELIDFWKTLPKEENTYNKCRELIKKFDGVDKYKYIIEEFKFYTLPNSNYFSISELDSEWLPAKDLTNLGPQVVTNAGNVYYNEPGFEFSNDGDNSWVGISKFRDSYNDVMQISSVKMLTSEEIQGIDVSGHINIGYPFILTKLGKSYDQSLMDEELLQEFLLDIKEGRSSNIRVVYLAKPKIPLNSYLGKVHSFIFNKGTKTEFGNIFTTYKILEALFRNFDENKDILNPNSERTKIVKDLIDKVSTIKPDKNEPYTKEQSEQVIKLLKDTFDAAGYGRRAEITFEGQEISVKTLFDSFVANLFKTSDTDTKIDQDKLNIVAQRIKNSNPSLSFIYADGIKFKTDDGIATLADSYLLDGAEGLNSEEFFIHAKITLPMFFNERNGEHGFVHRFLNEFVIGGKYSRHNYDYFDITTKKTDSGKRQIVRAGQYKYGKSKVTTKLKPGSEKKVLSLSEYNSNIDKAFEKFENGQKNVTNAKTLIVNIIGTASEVSEIYPEFDPNKLMARLWNTLLKDGLVCVTGSYGLKCYNLKTRPYNSIGKFASFKIDETTKEDILLFQSGNNLLEYKFRFLEDGTLDLYQISNPIIPENSSISYKTDLDNLIRDDEFKAILKYNKTLSKLFDKLKFTNFNDSFYDALSTLSEIQRKSYLATIKKIINDSDASELFKKQASVLDNCITPPKC